MTRPPRLSFIVYWTLKASLQMCDYSLLDMNRFVENGMLTDVRPPTPALLLRCTLWR